MKIETKDITCRCIGSTITNVWIVARDGDDNIYDDNYNSNNDNTSNIILLSIFVFKDNFLFCFCFGGNLCRSISKMTRSFKL